MDKKSVLWWLWAFLAGCVLGWLAEVTLYFFKAGEFVNRGVLHGPWMPMYGFGVVIFVYLFCKWRFEPRYPAVFILGLMLTGLLEYTTAAILENGFAQRWWNYGSTFLSINGRVWFPALIAFSLGGTLVARVLVHLLDSLNGKGRSAAALMLTAIALDLCYSIISPNSGRFISAPL